MDVRLLVSLTLGGLAASCVSGPPGGGPGGRPPLEFMPDAVLVADAIPLLDADANRDRETDTAEMLAWIAEQWALLSHGQPSVGRAAFEDWGAALLGARDVSSQFGGLFFDHNLDMRISEEEFRSELMRRFKARDVNQDGKVTRNELFVRLPTPEPMMRPPGGMPGGGMPPGGPPGGGGPGGRGGPGGPGGGGGRPY